jgi:uncharacterized protein (TIGR02145 family)
MKKFTFLLATILMSLSLLAQTPQGINYQTVIRDVDGNILPYTELSLQMTIRSDAPDGDVVYSETHSLQTNGFGLVNLVIGQGIPVTGQFDVIVWSDGEFYLETGITFDGSPNYIMVGVTQLLTVPFSKYADFAGGLKSMTTEERDALQNLSVGYAIYNTTTNCLNYWNGNNWFETCGDCTPQPSQAVAGDDQYFSDETTATYLQGNTAESGNGLWSVVSGNGGNFQDATNPETLFTGLSCESYILMWEISTSCSSTSDQVSIQFDAIPTTAEAGQDILINTEELTVQLSANTPLVGSGLWTVVNGDGGVFDDAGNPQTNFTGLSCESYTLRWTISTDCYESADEMNVTFDAIPTTANAGDDIIINDETTTINLAANIPEEGSGLWTVISGNGGLLEDASDPGTLFTFLLCENYILRWTISTLCNESYDEMAINFDQTPATVNAGNDFTICENNFHSLNGQAENYSSLLWTTSGTGNFSNNAILNPTYTPSPDDIAEGEVMLTLIAEALSPCVPATSDDLMLTIQQLPIAFAGEDITICETQLNVSLEGTVQNATSLLWTTSGDGFFIGETTAAPYYYPSAADIINGEATITLTAFSEYCPAVSDHLLISIEHAPLVFAGDDATICAGETFTTNDAFGFFYQSISWLTSGDGSFANPGELVTTYNPGPLDIQTGSVVLCLTTLVTGPCQNDTDCFALTILPPANVSAGNDAEICANNTHTLSGQAQHYSSVHWVTSGTGSFSNTGILNPVYSPSQSDITAGAVILTITAYPAVQCVLTATDEMTLSFLPLPLVNAGPDQEDLPGTATTLQGNNPTGGATGLWSIASGAGGSISQPNNPTSQFSGVGGETYLLQWSITAPNGCTNSDFVIIGFLVQDGSPCPGMPTVTDIDGNVYNTVKIGNQCWMKENLKTTKYRNGTTIENPTGNTEWQNNTTGAYAWYNNDIGYKNTYGALYNWYAVDNSDGLCPTGWHVPTDAQWTALTTYVSSQPAYLCNSNTNYTAKALAAKTNWSSNSGTCTVGNNLNANNSTNFTALPGGYRSIGGLFNYVSYSGHWWSSTEYSAIGAWYRMMGYNYVNVGRSYDSKTHGYSVRCLKDN